MIFRMGTFQPSPGEGGQGFTIGELLLASTLLPISGNGSVTPKVEIMDDADFQIRVTRVVLAFITIALIVVAIGGNVIVICAILNTPYLRRLNNYLIVSLSLADLGTAVFCMPFFVMELFYNYGWPLSHALCGLYAAIEISFGLLSVFTLGAISCERVFLITKPMVYQRIVTEVRLIIFIVVLWVVCFSYGFLQIAWFYTDSYYQWSILNPDKCRYLPSREFTIFAFMIAFVLPLGIMTGAYMKIFCVVRGQIQRIRPRLQSCTEDGLSEDFSTFHMDKARSDRNPSIGGIPEHRSLENLFENKSITEVPPKSEPCGMTEDLGGDIGVGQDALEVIPTKDSNETSQNSTTASLKDTKTCESQETKTNDSEGNGNVENKASDEAIENGNVRCNENSPSCNPTRPNSHCSHTSSSPTHTNGNEPHGIELETKVNSHNNAPEATEDVTRPQSQAGQSQLGTLGTRSEKPIVESAAGVTIMVESPREDASPINLVSRGFQARESSASPQGAVCGNGITPDPVDRQVVSVSEQADIGVVTVPAGEPPDLTISVDTCEKDTSQAKSSMSGIENKMTDCISDYGQSKEQIAVNCEKDSDNNKERPSMGNKPEKELQYPNSEDTNTKGICSNTEETANVQKAEESAETQSRSSSKCSSGKKHTITSSLSSVILNRSETVLQIAVSPADPSHSTSWEENQDKIDAEDLHKESDLSVKEIGAESQAASVIEATQDGNSKLGLAFPESRARSSSCNEMTLPSTPPSGELRDNQVSVPLRRVSSACELPILDKIQGVKTEPHRLHSVLKKPNGPKGLENYPLHQKRNSVQFKLYDDAVLEPGSAGDQGLRAVLVDDETTGSSEGNTTETSLSSTHPQQKVTAGHRNGIEDGDGDTTSIAHTPSHRHTLQWARRHFNSIDSAFMTSAASISQYSHSNAMSDGVALSRRSSRRRSRLFENKAVRMTSYVIGAFVVCWVPYQICMMLRLFAPKLVPDILWNVTTVIMFTSTAINPFIYNFYSSQFRAATRKLLKCQKNVVHPE